MVAFKNLFLAGTLAVSTIAAPVKDVTVEKRSGSGKRGAAYNDASLVKTLFEGGPIGWAYNWNAKPDGPLPPGLMFIPMLWGKKNLDGWSSAVQDALNSGSKYIFGFNEPDDNGQSAMSVPDAVSLFKQNITPYGDKASLVTPAVTNAGGPNKGLDWMKSFMDSCGDCKVSIMAIHWYGDDPEDFKKHVSDAVNLAKQKGLKEVWVTEFALNDPTKAVDFLTKVLPWLDSQDGVGGYAYFYCASGFLLDGNALSPSGKVYTSS